MEKLGLIAGNGRFPFLVLDEAVRRGISVVVAAIKEETDKAIDEHARHAAVPVTVEWIGLGQLGRLIRFFQTEGVRQAVMAGQVKHKHVFSADPDTARRLLSALPDVRMLRLLFSLPKKNTESLIGGIADVLAEEGIELLDSTFLLTNLMPAPGPVTLRDLSEEERRDVEYGWPIARQLADLDVGQTIVVKNQAVVAVEAMEGTDAAIRRAAGLSGGMSLTVIKVSRPKQDMRFDVPVLGLGSIGVFEECRVTALAVEAGKTLLLDREDFVRECDRLKVAVVAREP